MNSIQVTHSATASTVTSDLKRLKLVIEDLERELIAFMRKHSITHDEYRHATNLLIKTVKAGEESLLYDVFLEAESTDIGNRLLESSPQAIEGPFYVAGAPVLRFPYVMPMRPEEPGHKLIFRGRVTDTSGASVAGAELDVWQADAAGLYSNIHPDIPAWNLRARFHTQADGTFEVRTILPPPYEIPKDGPTGQILTALGRHFFRPAHIHVKVRHADCVEMTSQIYFEGGEYLDNDVANAVREGLIAPLVEGREPGSFDVRYDFVLKSAT